MKKLRFYLLLGLFILLINIPLYMLWENKRIVVVSQDIEINELPIELDGFTILQISDLHEREFGKNQKRMLKKINGVDYDVLVFTGDILNDPESTNDDSFYTLLEGIENKENILYVQGNADPSSYDITDRLEKSEFIQGMEERGARLLESFETTFVGDVPIHIVNFDMAIIKNPEYIGKLNGTVMDAYANDPQYQTYQRKKWMEMVMQGILDTNDTLIALNHYPIPDARFEYIKEDSHTSMRDFDLIIAGHYHGGQIRIPFYGALFIPDPWYEPNSYFPPQDRVKGLWEYEGIKQYVSAGLGSSEAIPYVKFRLFNPPEINVIRLKQEK